MSCLFSWLRILVVATAVAIVNTKIQLVEEVVHRGRNDQDSEMESFELVSDVRSSLFSQCMAAKNTVEGSLYSIAVDEDIEYVRFDASGSTRTVTWETESGIPDTVECAFAAHERGAFMFKFTLSEGCQLAMDNAYDRSQAVCGGGEIVYITTRNFCINSKNAYKVGETTNDFCPRNCTEDGLVYSEPRLEEYVYFPEPGCCIGSNVDIDRCAVVHDDAATMCQTDDICSAASLVIFAMDNTDDVQYGFDLIAQEGYAVWAGIYKDDSGVWRHLASDELVNSALWGPGEPSDAGRCAVITPSRNIAASPCDVGVGVFCEEPFDDFPSCYA